MPVQAKATESPAQAISRLVSEARMSADKDRRSDERFPFFRPVSIRRDGLCVSAFTRDISNSAVGLLHNIELSPGKAEISIASDRGDSVSVNSRVSWCRPCGEGWYISAAEFVEDVTVGDDPCR
jgi:hypothetical protein